MAEPVRGYTTVAALKAILRQPHPGFDDAYARAIEAASRRIDAYCGDHFWLSETPTAREFQPIDHFRLLVGSFATTDGMTVEIDTGAGYTTLDNTQWAPDNTGLPPGRPSRQIRAVGVTRFPALPRGGPSWSRLPGRVRVTARWGWPSIPPQVVQACLLLAAEEFEPTNPERNTPLPSATSGFLPGPQLLRDNGLPERAEALLRDLRIIAPI